jgi:hypothetical protein
MAAPNIINANTIIGKTSVLDVTTVVTSIVTNSNSSNKVIKLNSLIVANESNSSNYKITAEIYSLSRTPNSSYITYQVPIPFLSSLDIISKTIYLEEGDSLRLTADANTFLSGVCSYEEIS